jgi:transposase-like protein
MDLADTFCPNLDCPARGQIGQGNLGIHSRKEQRLICKQCHKTFTARKGTAFYRLRTPAETVSVVLTLLAHGCPLQASVVACGFDERTVAAWFARAGRQAQAELMKKGIKRPPVLDRLFVLSWRGSRRLFSVALAGSRPAFSCTTQAHIWWVLFPRLFGRPRGLFALP